MIGYLGIGSNVGDRRANLLAATTGLNRRVVDSDEAGHRADVRVDASSSIYESAPVGLVLDQPAFLNACLRIAVAEGTDPRALLDHVKALELTLGRVPGGVRHGPRVIDIDVLLLGENSVTDDRLTVPHPGLRERRFVLEPLLELDPNLTLPDGTALAPALGRVLDQVVSVVGPPLT